MSSNKHSTSHCAAHNCIHTRSQALHISWTTASTLNAHHVLSPHLILAQNWQKPRLPSAVHTSTPAFDVPSSGLLCGWPYGLELVIRLPVRSVTFLWPFLPGTENFFSRFTNAHTRALDALWFYALYKSTIDKQKLGGGPSHTSTSEFQQHAHKTVVLSPSSVNLNCSFTQHQSRQQQITWQVSQ